MFPPHMLYEGKPPEEASEDSPCILDPEASLLCCHNSLSLVPLQTEMKPSHPTALRPILTLSPLCAHMFQVVYSGLPSKTSTHCSFLLWCYILCPSPPLWSVCGELYQ